LNAVRRDLPPLLLRAAVRPETVDAEARTAAIIWSTGARILPGFWESYYENLSLDPDHVRMDRLNDGPP